jgi:hypothetical protein
MVQPNYQELNPEDVKTAKQNGVLREPWALRQGRRVNNLSSAKKFFQSLF